MPLKETLIEALEKWAKVHPDKLAWQFHNDKLEIEDTYTFKVRPQAYMLHIVQSLLTSSHFHCSLI